MLKEGSKKLIRRTHSRQFSKIIEIKVPVRFYWTTDDHFDGFEFGPLTECSRHQVRILRQIAELLTHHAYCAKCFEYMKSHHPGELERFIEALSAKELGIPLAVIDAFREEEQ